jgi:hypothetical protein
MRRLLLTFLALVAISPAPCGARSMIPEPRLSDLATAWLGSSPRSIVEYFRLELDNSGKGILVVQYLPQNPPRLYEVSVSRLKGYDIKFDVLAVDSDAEPVFLQGHATSLALDLEIGGTKRTWKKRIFLEREDRVLERIRVVTERATKARQQ